MEEMLCVTCIQDRAAKAARVDSRAVKAVRTVRARVVRTVPVKTSLGRAETVRVRVAATVAKR